MWLKIAAIPVCVAFFQYTETTIEKISLCWLRVAHYNANANLKAARRPTKKCYFGEHQRNKNTTSTSVHRKRTEKQRKTSAPE